MSQQHPDDRPPSRRRSSPQKEMSRPKSRTSTTSLQSVDVGHSFQSHPMLNDQHYQMQPQKTNFISVQSHPQQQVPMQPYGHGAPVTQQMAPQMPPQMQQSAMPQQFPPQMPHQMSQQIAPAHYQHHPSIEQVHNLGSQDMRPVSQQGFHEPTYGMPYGNAMPYQPHMQHFRRDSVHYEGSPAPDDSNNETKRKKGTASTLANDQELRRLLQQHEGKTLRDVALEVQKTEGQNGGKAEKAKQVFAMIWLRESCVRSSSSVRRDRVFARYTERCGGERVPTLNPASFGKLVRIIFPNVQTRRLGVRGESKYHYVDLALVSNNQDEAVYSAMQTYTRPSTSSGMKQDAAAENSVGPAVTEDRPASRQELETADFPMPQPDEEAEFSFKASVAYEEPSTKAPSRLCCLHANTGTVRIPTRSLTNALVATLPSALPHLPGTIASYAAMPQPDLVSQQNSAEDAPVQLPDIAPYLANVDHDPSIAQSLYHLYRSYCTDVISSFRVCREKPFFAHYTAFNGKMTVPVSKLFNLECLAPWIQECDMRMYKQLARFTAPLVLQKIPDQLWSVFDNIAARLVRHVIGAFEEKCPVHVVVAKTVPAARFANLLKKLKAANASVRHMDALLEDGLRRTQMWLNLLEHVDPDVVLEESRPPVECLPYIQGVLKHDLRSLLDPEATELTLTAEEDMTSAYPVFLDEASTDLPGVLSLDALDQSTDLLVKWVSWLQCLPQTFQEHHPTCMLGWHGRFWRSILHQLGAKSTQSFTEWWYAENFTTSLLSWMAEMQGLLMSEADQRHADTREAEKMQQVMSTFPATSLGKRKRGTDSFFDEGRSNKRATSEKFADSVVSTPVVTRVQNRRDAAADQGEPPLPEMPTTEPGDTDIEGDDLRGPDHLDLPSLPNYSLSSPLKMSKTPMRTGAGGPNDDSGIDLNFDGEAEAVKAFSKADWFMVSSDPAEPVGGPGVVA